jgi:DNA-binding NarL/FixJ family response regulator
MKQMMSLISQFSNNLQSVLSVNLIVPNKPLSSLEKSILQLRVSGKANRECAESLGISVTKVENEVRKLNQKLGKPSEWMRYAKQEGWI